MMKAPLLFLALAAFASRLHAADSPWPYAAAAAQAGNALGIDLLAHAGKPGENAVLSPFSIQEALMMAFSGADGETRVEMMKTLHIPKSASALESSFINLQQEFGDVVTDSVNVAKNEAAATGGKPGEPIVLFVANRLFAQAGFEFRKPFLETMNYYYAAPSDELDFEKDPAKAAQVINDWVSEHTGKHISGLVPDGALTNRTRLVLANAIYFKAPWQKGFTNAATKPAPFHVNGGEAVDVPMMEGFDIKLGLAKRKGYTAVSIPYAGTDLQFLVLLPDKADGLAALEAKLTPELLYSCTRLEVSTMDLGLPKFKLEPPVMNLNGTLQALGMKTAFGMSADFSRMSPKPLYISGVFHKCFLSVDENGTEAAAASAVAMALKDGDAPYNIQVDHPFLFAVQDYKTGACLFIGRVTDPRPTTPTETTP